MTRSFTFGKYYPFHKGHEELIRFALGESDEVIVVICVSKSETISGEIRAEWIKKSFPNATRLIIKVFDYSEDDLPNTSESSETVSKIWSDQFSKILPKVDRVVTSEKYGDFVAQFMGIKHLPYNPNRTITPISSTNIRTDLSSNWTFLPEGVKSYFLKKVVIVGTESTGKSTLCELLAEHYRCDYVPEVARSINEHSNECTMDDLKHIASAHAQAIHQSSLSSQKPLLIIDTDIYITKSYANFLFHQDLTVPQHIIEANKADLYIFLNNDCSHIQDGTRLTKEDRDRLHLSHIKTLEKNNISYIRISGDWESRFQKAVEHIDQLLARAKTEC